MEIRRGGGETRPRPWHALRGTRGPRASKVRHKTLMTRWPGHRRQIGVLAAWPLIVVEAHADESGHTGDRPDHVQLHDTQVNVVVIARRKK